MAHPGGCSVLRILGSAPGAPACRESGHSVPGGLGPPSALPGVSSMTAVTFLLAVSLVPRTVSLLNLFATAFLV